MSWKKAYLEKYHRENMRNDREIYVCVVDDCPKCHKKGYKHYQRQKNVATGQCYPYHTLVRHHHNEYVNGKWTTLHDGVCYVGLGKL